MTRAILTPLGAFAIVLLLALAACMIGDSGGNSGPPRPYCSYQAVPGCVP